MLRLRAHLVIFVLLTTLSPDAFAQDGWHPVTDREGGFIISFPGRPKYQQIPNRQYGFTSESYSFFYQNHTLQISFVPLEIPPQTPQEALRALNDSSASYTTGFGRLLRQEKLPDGGRQYDNIYSDAGISMKIRTRLYVRHGNLYTLSCTAEADGGINDRIAGQFFSSFRFLEDLPKQRPSRQKRVTKRNVKSATHSRWFIQRGPDGDFSIEFPSKPEYRLVRDEKIDIPLHQYLSFFGENHFIVSYRDKTGAEVDVRHVSRISVQGLIASHPGLRVIGQSQLPDGGHQVVLRGMMSEGLAHVRTRAYVRGERVYFVSSTTWNLAGPNESDADRFFSSFRLL